MLPPKKQNKKPSPARKYKPSSSSEVDWDMIRSINDNPVTQAAKIFDPTGISSYPDVYYAAKDLSEGKGSWGELGLSILGALPMVGKAKVAFRLAKTGNASKTVKATQKVLNTVEKVATKSNKVVNAPINKLKPLANSTKVVPKIIGKTAEKTENLAKVIGKPLTPKGQIVGSKTITKSDVKNAAVDLLDITNVASDVNSTVTATSKKIKEVENKNYQSIPKKVIYYNTDPKKGKVEKPGEDPNASYTPVTNSIQLKKWQEQQLAYGTNSQGIMKSKMNPRKKYAQGTSAKGINPNNYIINPAETLNDYNIMLAKAEAQSNANPWLPVVAMVGGLAQQAIGIGASASGKTKNGSGSKFEVGGGFDEVNKNINTEAINKFDFSSDNASLNKGIIAAMGNNNVQKDVEVEGGEMFETPQGEVGEFQGPSHEQGGIPLEVGEDVEEGTKVYSDRLKIGDKTLADRKATRERQIANLEKIASNPLADAAVKNAAKRKMSAIEKEESMDLQFQEQVNNIQTMADTMVKAFGTGTSGIQKYEGGTGEDGIQIDRFGNPITDPIVDLQAMTITPGVVGPSKSAKFKLSGDPLADLASNPREYMKATITPDTYFKNSNNVKTFQDWMDTNNPNWLSTGKSLNKGRGYGTYGPNTQKAAGTSFEAFKTSLLPAETVAPVSDYGAQSFLDTFVNAEAEEDAAFYKPGQVGTPIAKEKSADKKEPSKFAKALEGNMPAIGDLTKLFGNYLGMTAGIKTAAEQRSTDVTHTNTFANAGEESQRLLDNAKQGIEIAKNQAILKATSVGRGGKKGARGTARGVNTMRATDWLYDTALQEQIAQISANAAQQISGIDTQKSSVAMSADQLKGQGQYQADMANEAAKDAYYTALGLGRKDFASGMQQTGKDLNDMKKNKIIANLLENSGDYVGMTRKGEFYGKPVKTSEKTKTPEEEALKLELDSLGNKFITVAGKKIIVKE